MDLMIESLPRLLTATKLTIELTLLSLTEVIGGIFWVWLPWLVINEIPSTNTIIGGFFIFIAIFYYSLIMQTNRRFIGLN